ncbi:unnamed protein product, partial [Scytosiphon promiscuus]
MASRPRSHEEVGGGRPGEERVQGILSICPAAMGSGLEVLLTESERSGRLRAQAVARIKALLEQVKANIKDPDRSLCSDLQRIAELRPAVFREPELLEAVGEILTGRGAKTAIQASGGREAPCVAQSAACAMLMAALKTLPEWPVALLDIYMHDALGGRQWASHSACKTFVENLRTAWAPPPGATPPGGKHRQPPPLPPNLKRGGSSASSSGSGAAGSRGGGGGGAGPAGAGYSSAAAAGPTPMAVGGGGGSDDE